MYYGSLEPDQHTPIKSDLKIYLKSMFQNNLLEYTENNQSNSLNPFMTEADII